MKASKSPKELAMERYNLERGSSALESFCDCYREVYKEGTWGSEEEAFSLACKIFEKRLKDSKLPEGGSQAD